MSKTIVNDRSIVAGPGHSIAGSVISKDGTTIGYRQLGAGPGLVVLHGAMESAQSHLQLAEALADKYTVYLPDRRGRGLSGPYGTGSVVGEAVEDLDALLAKAGAHYVFGSARARSSRSRPPSPFRPFRRPRSSNLRSS